MAQYETYQTLPPYELTEELATRVAELGMEDNLKQMQEVGYTVLLDPAPLETTERVREACIRLAQETEGKRKGYSAPMLLGRDPVFEEIVLNAKLMTMVEYMCGQGALISQFTASVRPEGTPPLPLHADQNWTPAPFPDHNQLLTACWACDEFTEAGGSTRVIPGTHKLKRHPTPDETKESKGAIAIECPAGSIAVWDGSVWHGNCARELPGDRVVVHMTYSRLALRPIEDYSHLGQDFLDRNPPEMATLLGRTDFFGSTTPTNGGANMELFMKTSAMSKR
jgi:hypothetical protein